MNFFSAIISVCFFLVLLPVSNESTPTILEVDFFNLLVSVEQNVCLDDVVIIKFTVYFKQF